MTFRPLIIPTILTLIMLPILITLGVWQLQRLEWKEDLIAKVAARQNLDPVPLDRALDEAEDLDALDYRPVTVTGFYDHERELHVFAYRSELGVGYWIFTPLVRDDGTMVLVNRGFVPERLKSAVQRPESLTEGTVTVEGLARLYEEPGLVPPADDPEDNVYFTRIRERFLFALGLPDLAPVYVEAAAGQGESLYPKGGQTQIDFPNNHFSYALTWFGFAVILVAVYLMFHLQQGRLRFGGGRSV